MEDLIFRAVAAHTDSLPQYSPFVKSRSNVRFQIFRSLENSFAGVESTQWIQQSNFRLNTFHWQQDFLSHPIFSSHMVLSDVLEPNQLIKLPFIISFAGVDSHSVICFVSSPAKPHKDGTIAIYKMTPQWLWTAQRPWCPQCQILHLPRNSSRAYLKKIKQKYRVVIMNVKYQCCNFSNDHWILVSRLINFF